MPPVVLLNAVGLTPRLLPHAPRLSARAKSAWVRPMPEVVPAVTCTAQATMLTGEPVSRHGIVANGWLYRDTAEVRFWQQSNRLIQAEPLYATAARHAAERGKRFHCAKLFWWFNQGAAVEFSVTPKPFYGIDGSKVFGITGTPEGLTEGLEAELGAFPFATFWGPMAGLPCTKWIGQAAARVIDEHKPDLTLVYLPHLDYDPQRHGPKGSDYPRLVRELDDACEPILDAARRLGAEVCVVSEYGHCQVDQVVYPNQVLRVAGYLKVRTGPFGDQLDTFISRAFAVCDHQIAHVYVNHPEEVPAVRDLLAPLPGVGRVLVGEERAEFNLTHERAGDIVLLSRPDAWFAYPFWLEEKNAPDYARSVAIHHKPGFDPCELFFDTRRLRFPKLHIAHRLAQKSLGMRMTLDVVPLDASLVKGSHGLPASDAQDRPLFIGPGPAPAEDSFPMTSVKARLLETLDLA